MSANSNRPLELESKVVKDGVRHRVRTVDLGREKAKVVTRVYKGPSIVSEESAGYVHFLKAADFGKKLKALMREHHSAVKRGFASGYQETPQKLETSRMKETPRMQETAGTTGTRAEYFREANALLRKGQGGTALQVLEDALREYPSDPVLLSYYGSLTAVVGRDPRKGIGLCKKALGLLRESSGGDRFYPVFYLNLGRAYVAKGDKEEAIKVFTRGLRVEPGNRDLRRELKKLGTRKPPPLAFLRRDNPINKYLGLLLRKGTKAGGTA